MNPPKSRYTYSKSKLNFDKEEAIYRGIFSKFQIKIPPIFQKNRGILTVYF
jgi:hypothetical protein